jgi:hypothetical protein
MRFFDAGPPLCGRVVERWCEAHLPAMRSRFIERMTDIAFQASTKRSGELWALVPQ